MRHPRLRDLDALGATTFRVTHIASDALAVDPTASAIEAQCWLEANDFDRAPVRGAWPPRAVSREDLRAAARTDRVEDHARVVAVARRVPPSLGLREAIDRLGVYGDLVVCDDDAVTGVVTRHDLARPVVSLYVLGLSLAIEQGLRRLVGTYANRPLADQASEAPPDGEPRTFAEVRDAAWRWTDGRLPRALGYPSHAAFTRATDPARRLRNHVAHGRSALHEVDVAHLPATLAAVQELADRVWEHAHDRPQVWSAFRDSRLVDRGAPPASERARVPPGAPAAHVITACNPHEEVLAAEINARRAAALEALLTHRGLRFDPVDGVSADGAWRERSFLVHGLDRAAACALADRFGQRAVFEVDAAELRVVRVDGAVMARRPFPAPATSPSAPDP